MNDNTSLLLSIISCPTVRQDGIIIIPTRICILSDSIRNTDLVLCLIVLCLVVLSLIVPVIHPQTPYSIRITSWHASILPLCESNPYQCASYYVV